MPTFSITHLQVTDDHVVIQTLESTEIGTGQSVTISGVSATFNGSHTVLDVPTYRFMGVDDEGDFIFDPEDYIPDQLLAYLNTDDVARYSLQPLGNLVWNPQCTWINNQKVIDWLGIASATSNDTSFITNCVAAANAYAYRRRREAGYFDSLNTVPGGDVELGTTMFAAALYRERGSVDSFASFEQMGTPVPFGSHGQINRLFGHQPFAGRMTATGIFAAAQSTVVSTLTALGLKVVTDVRNARPLTVLVDPPTFTAFNSNIAEIEIDLKVLAAPPANQDQIDYLITTADTIMNSALSLVRGIPGVMQIGGQEVPTYDLTVRVSTMRS